MKRFLSVLTGLCLALTGTGLRAMAARTIRTDGRGLTKIHTRTMNMGIAGREFWSADGQWITLFRPRPNPDVAGIKAANSQDLA